MKKNVFGMIAVTLLLSSGGLDAQKNNDIEKNKEFIQAYTSDFWNKHNIDSFDKYFSKDFIVHFPEGDMNADQYKGLCTAYFAAFPDLYITTNDQIAEGNKVMKMWTANCTHKGDFMGIPATGKPIEIKGIEMFRIAEGKIAELWAAMDNLGMLQQLGVLPPMGQ